MPSNQTRLPDGATPPKGPFVLRICAGCGEQVNDGHHGHGWPSGSGKGLLTPTYDYPIPNPADLVHVDQVTDRDMRLAHLLDAVDRFSARADCPEYLREAARLARAR